jgi:hypothetical protein
VLQPTGLLQPRRHDHAGILGRRAMILRNKFKDMFRILILECQSHATKSDYG